MEEQQDSGSFLERLKKKYRLVVINESTFEEKWATSVSRLNIYTIVSLTAILLFISSFFVIAFTPLRNYVPGYINVTLKPQIQKQEAIIDSLEIVAEQRGRYIENLQMIMMGENPEDSTLRLRAQSEPLKKSNLNYKPSVEDSLLRAKFESETSYEIGLGEGENQSLHNIVLFPPLKGNISSSFNPVQKHYGVDIVPSNEGEPIKSIYEGTVVFASWTPEDGQVIHIQHEYNLLSVYKHNSSLLKAVGDRVKTGEVIAIVGNTGKHSSGPHLHFELWRKRIPLNPKDYIAF